MAILTPTFNSFSPASAPVGGSFNINGNNLHRVCVVLFNGNVPAASGNPPYASICVDNNPSSGTANGGLTARSQTQLTVVVQPGATDGPLTLLGPDRKLTTPISFNVT